MKKHLKSLSLSALAIAAASQAHAIGVGAFAIDPAAVSTEITAVGTVLCGVAVVFLTYKMARRLLAR